ncbi:MAG: sugar ABC transporter ATP-binding protein, partial [Christensenellaceae bacterium]|nr:sugar ABC transporter ATP-binding protein [Christensenellaceae bacterium]
MTLEGRPYRAHSCDKAIQRGVGYMTEDRKSLGLYLTFDIARNIAANRLGAFTRNGFIQDGKLRRDSEQTVVDFGVVTPSVHKIISQLSGGNQQKVLLAAWISIHPKLLIVDEPTRGVDVGAKCEIYQILRRMAKELHCGIMMISSDLPEVLGLSDRIVIMKDGRVVGILDGPTATEKSVMSLAAGTNKEE